MRTKKEMDDELENLNENDVYSIRVIINYKDGWSSNWDFTNRRSIRKLWEILKEYEN